MGVNSNDDAIEFAERPAVSALGACGVSIGVAATVAFLAAPFTTLRGVLALTALGTAAFMSLRGALLRRRRVLVREHTFHAGAFDVDLRRITSVEVLDRERLRWLAGPAADARALLVLRGSTQGGVKVSMMHADRYPYLLVSSTHPAELAHALERASQRARDRTEPGVQLRPNTTPGRSRPVARRVTALVGAFILVSYTGWNLWVVSNPEVQSQLVGFEVRDNHETVATVVVTYVDAQDVSCMVRAHAEDHTFVGDLHFRPPRPGSLHVPIRTERRATAVELLGCKAKGQPRRR